VLSLSGREEFEIARHHPTFTILSVSSTIHMESNTTITHSTLDEGSDFFITDHWGVKRHFKISSFLVGTGLQTETIEVVDNKNGREPYIFNILSDFDPPVMMKQIKGKNQLPT
jgi:hypothetical protein